jgi:hypothetical protein
MSVAVHLFATPPRQQYDCPDPDFNSTGDDDAPSITLEQPATSVETPAIREGLHVPEDSRPISSRIRILVRGLMLRIRDRLR